MLGTMAIVAIVGAGVMGSAVAFPLTDNGHTVRLVGTHLDGEIIDSVQESSFHPRLNRSLPSSVRAWRLEQISKALDGVDLIVSGVNSYGVEWQGQTLGKTLTKAVPIVAITKGLEIDGDGSLLSLTTKLERDIRSAGGPKCEVSGIGGPCIAGELAGRRQSCVLVGSQSLERASWIAGLLRTDYYHIQPTEKIFALEIGVALKNAYTLGVGIASGMLEREGGEDEAGALMFNLQAAVFAQGTSEIRYVLGAHGAPEHFAASLPGAGDYYVTVMGGRNIKLGRLLGSGLSTAEAFRKLEGITLEGVSIVRAMGRALPKLYERDVLKPERLPLLEYLIATIEGERAEPFPLERFFVDL